MILERLVALAFACAPIPIQQGDDIVDESNYYSVDFLPTPPGSIEVGGLDFLPNGSLVVSTRHGQVWIVENPCARNPADAKLRVFAEGLYEGLGLKVVNGEIYVLQRTELSRLRDTDGDGRCDTIDTISNRWGVSGNYHEFAYGLPRDKDGNFYISLNVSFFDPKWWHGKSTVPYRGWVMKIAPDGTTTPFACGFRSPNGLGLNAAGDLFATDNQGDWMPSCPLEQVKEGGFYGHPASLDWSPDYVANQKKASDTEPPARPRTQPACWIPYGLARSAGNPLLDDTGGKFGPFAGQMFVAELTNGLVLRADLEKVEGEYQGSAILHRRGTGSANRIAFAPDGTLFVGLTNRGWGGAPPADGLARVRFTGRVPMEMQTIRIQRDGFTIAFTLPLQKERDPLPSQVRLVQYDYNSWWDYGSPEVHVTPVAVTAVEIAPDRKSLRLHAPKLRAGMVARIVLDGIAGQGASGPEPLLHPQADYTINRFPGMKESVPVAKTVAPPATREELEEGWVTLFDRRSIDGFDAPGWRLAAVHMDPRDPTQLVDHPMVDEWDGMLVNAAGRSQDAVSLYSFGDCQARVEFMVSKNSNSGVYFMGRYELQILDSFGKQEVGFGDCGGIYESFDEPKSFAGSRPRVNACNAPGEWQRYDVLFRAPRFDAQAKKIANARFESALLNDQLIQKDVEVPVPTGGGFEPEVAIGPIRLQGDHGPVAYKKVRVKPIPPPGDEQGWTRIFDGKSLDGWSRGGDAQWTVEDGALVARGKPGALVSTAPARTPDLEQRCRVRIKEESTAAFAARAGAPSARSTAVESAGGYVARINNSCKEDARRTGSLDDVVTVKIPLVQDDLWFELRISCKEEAQGTHVIVRVNGVVTANLIDPQRRAASGRVALELTREGGEVRFKDVEIRELR